MPFAYCFFLVWLSADSCPSPTQIFAPVPLKLFLSSLYPDYSPIPTHIFPLSPSNFSPIPSLYPDPLHFPTADFPEYPSHKHAC